MFELYTCKQPSLIDCRKPIKIIILFVLSYVPKLSLSLDVYFNAGESPRQILNCGRRVKQDGHFCDVLHYYMLLNTHFFYHFMYTLGLLSPLTINRKTIFSYLLNNLFLQKNTDPLPPPEVSNGP